MPRAKLIRTSQFPYHIRSRSNNREWFYLSKADLWSLFAHIIEKTTEKYQLAVHLFVLMDNHFHMIASTPMANLDSGMQYLIREVSKNVGRRSGRINRIFGARYQRSILDDDVYLRNALKYVCRNPVVAGLTERVEDYSFSTLKWTLGRGKPLFSLSEKPDWVTAPIAANSTTVLKWLNAAYHPEQAELVRRGLRRQTCRWSTSSRFRPWTGKM